MFDPLQPNSAFGQVAKSLGKNPENEERGAETKTVTKKERQAVHRVRLLSNIAEDTDNDRAGAGGGNDIASVSREVVVVAVHRANRMVEKVRYITCPGTRVSTLATDEGLFVKNDTGFILKGYYPKPEVPEQKERIHQIEDACGWEMRTAPQLEKMKAPTPEELNLLRSFDPDCVFLR